MSFLIAKVQNYPIDELSSDHSYLVVNLIRWHRWRIREIGFGSLRRIASTWIRIGREWIDLWIFSFWLFHCFFFKCILSFRKDQFGCVFSGYLLFYFHWIVKSDFLVVIVYSPIRPLKKWDQINCEWSFKFVWIFLKVI